MSRKRPHPDGHEWSSRTSGRNVRRRLDRSRSSPQLIIYNRRISQAARRGDISYCWEIVDWINRQQYIRPDCYSYNPLISYYARKRDERVVYM